MLANKETIANLAVKDIEAARRFYEDTLGLTQVASECEDVLTFQSGASQFFVYRSDFAGSNQATAMSWACGEEIEQIAKTLADKGVRFEHYPDMPDTQLKGDIHHSQGMRIAWFKDPDGNILSLVTG